MERDKVVAYGDGGADGWVDTARDIRPAGGSARIPGVATAALLQADEAIQSDVRTRQKLPLLPHPGLQLGVFSGAQKLRRPLHGPGRHGAPHRDTLHHLQDRHFTQIHQLHMIL